MKNIAYTLLYNWVKLGLYAYYSSKRVEALERIPKKGALLFLGNHQNALIDSLQLVVHGVRKPYFLARSDVFSSALLKRFLTFLQMMPIYRIRDGIKSLQGNEAIFKRCAQLLHQGEAIAIFPEGNHALKRRVRPLSKGFTRIIFQLLEDYPQTPLYLQPYGVNYQKAGSFPDSCSLNFGPPILVDDIIEGVVEDKTKVDAIKKRVFDSLTGLTTHIDKEPYENIVAHLEAKGVDFKNPDDVNALWPRLDTDKSPEIRTGSRTKWARYILVTWNFVSIIPWRLWVKPKVKELEFMDTMRFGYALLSHSFLYVLLFVILLMTMGLELAVALPLAHFMVNLVLVKTYRSY